MRTAKDVFFTARHSLNEFQVLKSQNPRNILLFGITTTTKIDKPGFLSLDQSVLKPVKYPRGGTFQRLGRLKPRENAVSKK